ncbi:MAG: Ig-like domain-containing protein [Zymomonas mobilis]
MTSSLTITKKRGNHKAFSTEENRISLQHPSVVQLNAYRSQVHSLLRQGNTLLVQLNDGRQYQFDNFFVDDDKHLHSDLVLRDEDQKEAWWHAEMPDASHPTLAGSDVGYSQVETIKPLLIYHDSGLLVPLLAGILGAGAAGGAAAALTGGHSHKDNDGTTLSVPSVDSVTTDPTTGEVIVKGTAKPGQEVNVTFPDGSVTKVTADSKTGDYQATSSVPQKEGQIAVTSSDSSSANVSNPVTHDYTDIPPSVGISSDATQTVTGPVTYTFTLSEASKDFTANSVTVTGGTKGELVQDPSNPLVYHMVVTPDAGKGGTISVVVPAGTVHDLSGNTTTTDAVATPVSYDTTPAGNPVATVTSDSDGATVTGPVTYTFTLSEPVSDLTADSVNVSGGSKGALVQDPSNPLVYHMVVTPDAGKGGTVTATLPAGSLHDLAGNPTSSDATDTVSYDTTPAGNPVATVTSDSDGATVTGPVTYTFTLSEPVSDLTADSVNVSGGSKGALVQDPSNPLVYHMVVTPDAGKGGAVTVTLPAGSLHDLAGNPTSSDATDTVSYDTTPAGNPIVTVTSDSDGATATGPVTYTFTLLEAVSDLTADSVTVSGGTKGELVQDPSNPLVYHMVVTPDAGKGGTVTATLPAGSLHDLAGNPTSSDATDTVSYDTTPAGNPVATVTSDSDGATVTGPVTYTFTLSEPVSDLTADSVNVSGGSKGALVQDPSNPLVYHMVVTPDAGKGGTVTATLPAGSLHDLAGNPTSSDATDTVSYDTTPAGNPVATVTSDSDGATATGPVTYTFTLSEPVSDLTADRVNVSGGTKGELVQDPSNPLVYHMVVTPDAGKGGTVTATLPAGSLHDLAGNPTSSDATDTVSYDTTPAGNPVATVTSDSDGATATGPVTYTFTLSEPVSDLTADRVNVSGGTKGELVQDPSNPLVYHMVVTPDAGKGGTVTATLPAGSLHDLAGNPTSSDATDTVSYDTTPAGNPVATVTSDSDGATATGPVTYTFTLSEPVSDLTADRVNVSGGTKGELVQDPSNPLVYHMVVTPEPGKGGTVTATLPAGSLHDLAGNPTSSDATDTVSYDTTPAGNPSVTISSTHDNTTATNDAVTFGFTLSEPVSDFSADSINVTGGTKGSLISFPDNPLFYAIEVTPDANSSGTITATLPAGSLHDLAGNPTLSDTTDSVLYDTIPPALTITSDSDGATATGPVTYTFTLSEPVSDLTADSVTVSGGTKGTLVQDSSNPLVYHMVVTPDGSGSTITATLPAGSLHDLAGNPTSSDASDSVAYSAIPDVAPTVDVTSDSDGKTAIGPVTYTFTLSKPVSDFTADSVTVSGGSKGALTQDSSNPLVYHMVVTPDAGQNGTVTATIPAGSLHDLSGSATSSAATDSVPFDTMPPTITVTSPNGNDTTTEGDVTYVFTLSEPLKNFSADSINVYGGTKGSFVQDSSNPLSYTLTVTPDKNSGGTLIADIPVGSVQDLNGNPTVVDSRCSVNFFMLSDSPVRIISDQDGLTATSDITYSVAFTDQSQTLSANDLTVQNGDLKSLTFIDNSSNPYLSSYYQVVVSPTKDDTGINSLTVNENVINGVGAVTGIVPFDTRQLNLQDYTDTGSSATDYISQDNSFSLSLDKAANGVTPSYQVSTDNGDTWTDTSAVQNNIPDGHYLYRAVTGYHVYSNVIDLTVDTTKPDLISINPTNGQTVSGVAEAGATVNVLSNDGQTVLGTTVADSSNHWSISGLNIADNTPIKATATDVAGNVSSTVTARVDATPPAVTINSSDGATITGTSEAGTVVKVDTNGDGVADYTQTVGADGHWSIKPDTALANGSTVSVTSTDPVGNVSNAATTVVDNVAPVVTLTTADNQTVTGTVDDPTVTSVTIFDSTGNAVGTAAVTNGNYSLTLPEAVASETKLTASATDSAGNVGSSAVLDIVPEIAATSLALHQASITAITTDTIPTSAVSTNQNNDFVTRDDTLVVSGNSNLEGASDSAAEMPALMMSLAVSDDTSSSSGDVLQISSDGQNWTTLTPNSNGAWSWDEGKTHDSNFTYSLRTLDSAGNVLSTASKYVTVDLVAPPILTMPAWSDAGITVTKDGNTTVALIDDTNHDGVYEQGIDKVLATDSNNGTTAHLSATLTAGQHYNLGLVQYNAAGNYSRLSQTVSYTEPTTSALNTAFQAVVAPPQEARDTAGMATAFDSSGNLIVLQRSTLVTQTGSTNYALADTTQLPYLVRYTGQSSADRSTINSSTIADYNRDGFADVLASDYIDAATTGVAVWTGSQSGYSLTRSTSSNNSAGGVMAYDKDGDGYTDFVVGNWGPTDGSTNGSFIKNTNGVLSQDGANGLAGLTNFKFEREVSGVDLNGDGNVDIAAHTISNSDSTNQYALALIQNESGTLALTQSLDNVFNSRGTPTGTSGQSALPSVWGAQSLVWADFANNGQMDLYLSQGGNTPTGSSDDDSRIYMNNDGVLSSTPTIIADDNLHGAAATAIDWNHDGKMDVVEIRSTINQDYNNIPIVLLTNNGVDGSGTLNPFTATTLNTVLKANITGISAVDVNWDGAVDLLYSTTSGSDTQADGIGQPTQANIYSVMNTNAVADGTSLHLKILDQNGINSYFGNTVQLFDSSGKLVSTQIINPQEGMWDNDSTAIVNFYNLDPNEHYSAALVRASGGHSDDIGGQSSYGDNSEVAAMALFVSDSQSSSDSSSSTGISPALTSVENVEKSWSDLTPGAANHAYVLAGETTETHTNGGTFTGTGYDDTFFAGSGNNTYIGGGGWGYDSSGAYVWMSSGGHNVVDYSSELSSITVNMGNASGIGNVAISTSSDHDTLQGIQGIIGTAYDDTFTSDGKGDYFEGGGGNDIFNLGKGGHDTLMYKLLDGSDNTGGNGSDTVNDFHLGNTVNDPNADIINIKDLLADYQGTANVYYDVTENKFVLDKASSGLDQFVSTSVHNGNTTVSVDRDGANGTHQMTALVTLDNTQTDLATLIGNHQMIIA